ncbi:MAG: AMP-binding protein [Gallionellaceae bacterium]
MNTLPLLPHGSAAQIIAYRNARPVSRAEFLREVTDLAARLPTTSHVLNLCKDRYWFAVALFAAITRGMLSVLPNSTAAAEIAALQAEVPDLVCLGDQISSPFAQMPYVQVSNSASTTTQSATIPLMPHIPFDRKIVCVYTSGSTGKPQPHFKTFGRMQQCAIAEAERMWATAGGPCAVLGTVPFQHMYGLESSVLLPIFGGGQLTTRQPFFPTDIVSALEELPEPRFFVTTPFHLRKLIDTVSEIPRVAAILSATAPLSSELAMEVEKRFGSPLMEIYGSTETGQLATRRPTIQIEWEVYTDIKLTQEHGTVIAQGGHLEGAQTLNDIFELIDNFRFRLLGRNSDMINIAGKRNSLANLNHILTSLPGVQDGVFCIPDNGTENDAIRPAAFVVASGLNSAKILDALRLHVAPLFLPRPIIFLEHLQRDANGKISAAVLKDLISKHLTPRA